MIGSYDFCVFAHFSVVRRENESRSFVLGPLPKNTLRSKFEDCCKGIISNEQANEIYELAQSIEDADKLDTLIKVVGRRPELADKTSR